MDPMNADPKLPVLPPPPEVTKFSAGQSNIFVAFDSPASAEVQVACARSGTNDYTIFDFRFPERGELAVTGLNPGTRYKIKARASNAAGVSAWSIPFDIETEPRA